MRTLDCGCEVSADANTLPSMCSMHAGHMRLRQETERLPRNSVTVRVRDSDRALQLELVKLLAPVMLQRWSNVTDPHATAEMLFQHVARIMERLE